MTITIVAGARPNFMKIAPIIEAIKQKQSEKEFRFKTIKKLETMKTNLKNIGLLFLATILVSSCNDENDTAVTPPTAAKFAAVRKEALDRIKAAL